LLGAVGILENCGAMPQGKQER